jgi:tetratricopeptide (TPR) repeat protein
MNITTFVAFLILSFQCLADDLSTSTNAIENEWASIYYNLPKDKQENAFNNLLKKAETLSTQFPNNSDPLFWQAVIIATKAELQEGFSALKSVHKSKDLLIQAIKLNPKTANGSAYVTLGTLYYMVPQWPIGFGDNEKAEQMFLAALKINPTGIDANYFYGDFLLSNNKAKEAQKFFETAINSPSRKEQFFADEKLKTEAKLALSNAKDRKLNGIKSAFLSLFNSASLN